MKIEMSKYFRIKPICLITWMSLGYVIPANADVIVDPNQSHAPTIINNGNNSITVNINSASPSGISHNKFTQFDVNKSGLILNNSEKATNSTLAGSIAGNENMAKGPASLIINEVTSGNSSQLNGIIEVAGKKADVIVANPSGIACDGCGFINTGKSTLTTASLQLDNDKLVGINVNGGEITITGQGMEDKSDFTSLLASSVKVSANLQAKELQINAGNTSTSGNEEKQSVGLDISSLGGMYANKITLVVNKNGIGVSNSGLISADSDLNIDVFNTLENKGKIKVSSGDLAIISDKIENKKGEISSGGDMFMIAASELNNSQGSIHSDKNININGDLINNESGLISGNDISLVSNTLINKNSTQFGQEEETGKVDEQDPGKAVEQEAGKTVVTAAIKDNPVGGIYANDYVNINTNDLLDSENGIIHSLNDVVSLASMENINLDRADISANNINIYAEKLTGSTSGITAGKLTAKNDIAIEVNTFGKFDTATSIEAGNDISFRSNGREYGEKFIQAGNVKAGNNFSYSRSGSIVNSGNIQSGNDMNIKSDNLFNLNTINSDKNARFEVSNMLVNFAGKMSAAEKLSIRSPNVFNTKGELSSPKTIEIQSDRFENTGTASEVIQTPYKTPYQ